MPTTVTLRANRLNLFNTVETISLDECIFIYFILLFEFYRGLFWQEKWSYSMIIERDLYVCSVSLSTWEVVLSSNLGHISSF